MIGRFRLLGRARTTTKSRTVARTESGILVDIKEREERNRGTILVDIKEREERNRGTDTVHTYNTIPQYLGVSPTLYFTVPELRGLEHHPLQPMPVRSSAGKSR